MEVTPNYSDTTY